MKLNDKSSQIQNQLKKIENSSDHNQNYKYEGTGDFEGLIIESETHKENWGFGTVINFYSKPIEK